MRKDPVLADGDEAAMVAGLDETDAKDKDFNSGFVTLFGRSNVGKSTLLNRLVGQKVAIVTDVPQTTRRRLTGIRTYPDAQIIYVDTPGIHKPRFAMNERMVSIAVNCLDGVELLLLIVDCDAGIGPGDRYVMGLAEERGIPTFLILNKVDLVSKERLIQTIDEVTRERTFDEVIPVSALTGENVDRLEDLIRAKMPEGPRYFPDGTVTDSPERLLLAEILREKIILHTREELPHSSAVVLERMEESKRGVLEIDALVLVERDSQKGILIGTNGEMMRGIATDARREMEARMGTKVYLQVWVKVARNWRKDARMLDRIGLEESKSLDPES